MLVVSDVCGDLGKSYSVLVGGYNQNRLANIHNWRQHRNVFAEEKRLERLPTDHRDDNQV